MTKLSEIIASFVGRKSEPAPVVSSVVVTNEEAVSSESLTIEKEQRHEPSQRYESKEPGIEVTPEFQSAFKLIESGAPFVFITGRAGTGKSTFTNLLKDKLKSFALVAPTGVAALNVGGQTIHSFFRLAPGPIDFKKIQQLRNRIAYKALKTLIIDEISMVRADLLDAIDTFLRLNGPRRDRAFGGVQVIAIGDLFQLPPVISTQEEGDFLSRGYESSFFFSANCLKEIEIKSIEFSKVFRQTEEHFISVLNKIREGKDLGSALDIINRRVSSLGSEEFEGIVLTGTNAAASRLNDSRLTSINDPAMVYTGEVIGDFKVSQDKLPAPMELILKKGARVMFVKNDRAKKWVNGSIGTVVRCDLNNVTVALHDHYGTRELQVEPELWDNFKYEYNPDENAVVATKIGAYKQIPLTLAWAVTIHKSQGKTFDRVHVNLERGAFAEGQVYVALSRCRTLEGVTIQYPLRREDVHLNYDVIKFCHQYSSLAQ